MGAGGGAIYMYWHINYFIIREAYRETEHL